MDTFRVPDGLEYKFKKVDGFCCWAGKGWYELCEGLEIGDEASLIFHGNGDFGMESGESACIYRWWKIKKPGRPAINTAFPSSSNTTIPMLRGTAPHKIKRQRQHVIA